MSYIDELRKQCAEAEDRYPVGMSPQPLLVACNEVDALRLQLAEARNWRDGVPDVPEGGQRAFLVSSGGAIFVLLYSNRFVSPASDEAEPDDETETFPDSGEYYWTGWFEEACSQCDTFWRWDKPVDGWMALPKYKAKVSK